MFPVIDISLTSRKQKFLEGLLVSCRFLVSKHFCGTDPGFKALEPLTWGEKCAMLQCVKCPGFTLQCPEHRASTIVLLPQRSTKFCELKKKRIHIYRAAVQWDGYQAALASLRPGDCLIVVDYQMNGSVLHRDSTTGSHMGANTAQFAIYPAFLALCLPDGSVVRGGIIFLSKDTKHDQHQVK